MQPVYDYSYDGTMRALEQSHQRLGIERFDIVFIHDVDVWTHGSAEAYERATRRPSTVPFERWPTSVARAWSRPSVWA
jgi:aryl-alcohol dehydrogenase-like predicted oxidoreductase